MKDRNTSAQGAVIPREIFVVLFFMEINIKIDLKCHYDQILDTHFFTFSNTKRCFLDILANFNYHEH